MATPNLGETTATVWENRIGGKPRDVVFNSRAFFKSMEKNGFKEVADGGRLFEFTLEFAENTNFHSVSEMETLGTSRINVFDASRFTPKIAAGTLVLSNLEELRAAGKSSKLQAGLLASKMTNAKNSHIADMNRMCLGSASTGKDWNGIRHLISIDPTTGSVGGISRASFSFHRNRQASGAQTSSSFDNLRSGMTSIYNLCGLGGIDQMPEWVQCHRTEFEGYEQILVAIEQIADARMKKDSDIAFMNEMLKFKGTRMFFDEDATAGEMRFYQNTDLKLVYYKGGWMKLDPKVDPHNQLANVHKLATYAQLCSVGNRHLGVLSAIT